MNTITLDDNLIINAQAGNRDALEKICQQTWKYVYNFVYYKVNCKEEAEEITQETFYRAIVSLNKFNSCGKFTNYLIRIASNIIIDRWRQKKITVSPFDDVEVIYNENAFSQIEDRDYLKTHLKSLPEDYKKVLDYRIIKGYSVQVTSSYIGKSEGSVRLTQYRALNKLRKKISAIY
jgi:RNA polymerase sigma-70 factor (ECF subfamily)